MQSHYKVHLELFQESSSQTYPTTDDQAAHMVQLQQEGTADALSLSAAMVAITIGGQINQETPIVPVTGTGAPALEGENDQVNQAWFTTKEDMQRLSTVHRKGVQLREWKGKLEKQWRYWLNPQRKQYQTQTMNNMSGSPPVASVLSTAAFPVAF